LHRKLNKSVLQMRNPRTENSQHAMAAAWTWMQLHSYWRLYLHQQRLRHLPQARTNMYRPAKVRMLLVSPSVLFRGHKILMVINYNICIIGC
jgi:hypothetical protein